MHFHTLFFPQMAHKPPTENESNQKVITFRFKRRSTFENTQRERRERETRELVESSRYNHCKLTWPMTFVIPVPFANFWYRGRKGTEKPRPIYDQKQSIEEQETMFLRINFSGSFHSLPSPFPHSSSTGRIHCCYGLFPFPFSLILPTFSLIPHMRVKLLCNMGFYYFSVAFFLLLLQCCTTYSARERERDLGDGCWSF